MVFRSRTGAQHHGRETSGRDVACRRSGQHYGSNGGLMFGDHHMDLIHMIMRILKPSGTVTSWKHLYHQIQSGLNWHFMRNCGGHRG